MAVLESLPVPIILGTAFIDRHVKSIVQPERSIVPNHSTPVSILSTSTTSATLSTIDLDGVAQREIPSDYDCSVRVTSPSTITPWTEGTIRVRKNLPGLVFVTTEFDSKRRRAFAPAFGVVNVVPRRPFLIKIANSSELPLHVKQDILVAHPVDNYLFPTADDVLLSINQVKAISSQLENQVDRTPVLQTHSEGLVAPSLPSLKHGTGGTKPLSIDSAMAADTTPLKKRLNVGGGMKKHRPAIIDVLHPYSKMQ